MFYPNNIVELSLVRCGLTDGSLTQLFKLNKFLEISLQKLKLGITYSTQITTSLLTKPLKTSQTQLAALDSYN